MINSNLNAIINIDYIGMFTNNNPNGLYLNKMDENKKITDLRNVDQKLKKRINFKF